KADDIADAVDLRIEPRLRHAVGQPLARRDVVGRQGRTVDASLVGADLAQFVQVAENAVGIDGRHGFLTQTSARNSINRAGHDISPWAHTSPRRGPWKAFAGDDDVRVLGYAWYSNAGRSRWHSQASIIGPCWSRQWPLGWSARCGTWLCRSRGWRRLARPRPS